MNYHFVRERVTGKTLDVRFIGTNDQVADLLTKAIPKPTFDGFASKCTKELPLHLRGVLGFRDEV